MPSCNAKMALFEQRLDKHWRARRQKVIYWLHSGALLWLTTVYSWWINFRSTFYLVRVRAGNPFWLILTKLWHQAMNMSGGRQERSRRTVLFVLITSESHASQSVAKKTSGLYFFLNNNVAKLYKKIYYMCHITASFQWRLWLWGPEGLALLPPCNVHTFWMIRK